MRRVALVLAALCCGSPVLAHDFWVQPRAFEVPVRALTTMTVQVGHGSARETWSLDPARILLYRSIGPTGAVDRRVDLRPGAGPQVLRFSEAGTHVVTLQTNHATSNLPAARFNDFLKEEGLTPALRLRERSRKTGAPGREIYSRRAKALIQVGPAGGPAQRHVTTPVGLTLEIVPERNPYALKPGEALPVRVIYEGRPLPGALVKLTNLDNDAKPAATARTNLAGRATFNIPRRGSWLLNVVWTKPLKDRPGADFDTTFSSLAFGYPRNARGS